MRRVILAATASLVFAGCSQKPSDISASSAQDIVSKLTYSFDSRTRLCYAVVASRHELEAGQNGFTITYVPCTPEVLRLVQF